MGVEREHLIEDLLPERRRPADARDFRAGSREERDRDILRPDGRQYLPVLAAAEAACDRRQTPLAVFCRQCHRKRMIHSAPVVQVEHPALAVAAEHPFDERSFSLARAYDTDFRLRQIRLERKRELLHRRTSFQDDDLAASTVERLNFGLAISRKRLAKRVFRYDRRTSALHILLKVLISFVGNDSRVRHH